MAIPNDFSEYYKTISDTELLNILDNSNAYQPSAVDAAKQECNEMTTAIFSRPFNLWINFDRSWH